MNAESVAIQGIWASMNSWFTPTILFVFLNVVIGTIAVTSGLGSQKHQNQNHQLNNNNEDSNNQQQQKQNHQQQQQNEQQLNRSPSVLQRLKSINFYTYSYRSQEPISIHAPENKTHVLENRFDIEPEEQIHHDEHKVTEEEEHVTTGEAKSMEEIYGQLKGSSHHRTKSEIKPASGEIPIKLAKKMRKSASVKSPFSHFEEVETHRPMTVKEAKVSVAEVHDDEEVDAKADDFINKFKQQLKLQRLDSIVRYKEMLSRGSGK